MWLNVTLSGMLLKLVTENGKRKTRKWEREPDTENREQGQGPWNECTAVTCLMIQNDGEKKKKREQFGEI